MGLVGVGPKFCTAHCLVLTEVALKPAHLRVTLKRQHVGGHPVEEPPVMADDHSASGECLQTLLEGAQGVDVEVVGGFVEQQHVAALAKHLGQVHPISLAARQDPHLLLLVGTFEVECGYVGTGVHFPVAEPHELVATRDLLVHGARWIEGVPVLVNGSQLDGWPDGDRSLIGRLVAGEKTEQRGLAGSIGADHPDDSSPGQREVEVVDEKPVVVPLGQMVHLDDHVAKSIARWDVDLKLVGAGGSAVGLGQQTLVGSESGLTLGLASLGGHTHPFQLSFERASTLGVRAGRLRQTMLFLLEPCRVVALKRDSLAVVEFENPAGHIVQEIPIMGDSHDGAGVVTQEPLQPGDAFGIEMVGWLVKQQQVWPAQQEPTQRNTTSLATAEVGDVCVCWGEAQGVHGDLDGALEVPRLGGLDAPLQLGLAISKLFVVGIRVSPLGQNGVIFGEQSCHLAHAVHDVAQDVLFGIQLRLLLQQTNRESGGEAGIAGEAIVDARHDGQQR